MSYRADKLVIDTHTHGHTDPADDNTWRPKRASGKNAIIFYIWIFDYFILGVSMIITDTQTAHQNDQVPRNDR